MVYNSYTRILASAIILVFFAAGNGLQDANNLLAPSVVVPGRLHRWPEGSLSVLVLVCLPGDWHTRNWNSGHNRFLNTVRGSLD